MAKAIVLVALAAVVLWTGWRSWRVHIEKSEDLEANREWASLWPIPLAAYLLLTTTVHPWYLTTLLILIPIWAAGRWGWLKLAPWIYFSAFVVLSYLTYIDPLNLRETDFTRRWEYFPLAILLLAWAVAPRLAGGARIESS